MRSEMPFLALAFPPALPPLRPRSAAAWLIIDLRMSQMFTNRLHRVNYLVVRQNMAWLVAITSGATWMSNPL